MRDRIPTLSDVTELVHEKIQLERERATTIAEWLNARITRLESQVVLWGAIPTVAVAIAAILAYFRR